MLSTGSHLSILLGNSRYAQNADPKYFLQLSVSYSVLVDGRSSCLLSGPHIFLFSVPY